MKNVGAVLVTYNRLALLKESVAAILSQTHPVNELIIVNNNSTDGTADFLESLQASQNNITIVSTTENIGGAGGFSLGMNSAIQNRTNDFLWVMDDDTIPKADALEKLINPFADQIVGDGFTCSNVRWTDGGAAVMNIPYIVGQWNNLADKGLVAVKAASFVSLLVPIKTVKKLGLPIKEFFVWGDDYEFTVRISEKYDCYCVTDSIVIHKMTANHGVDIVSDSEGRIPRYYYSYRNSIYTESHHGGFHGLFTQLLRDVYAIYKVIRHSPNKRMKRINIILKGMFAGFVFRPHITFPDQKGNS
ncbi:glycosyltransferase family 2 protein [Furfurilactobacillus siliginis]|uniref:Glycosyl transferase n=1 Tax=Furfurilactobacillus siliginis TaxID=348151 RepID=A0A0R2L651_9LACO|nr:glycosyltransferase family 2 protein [Furfurilactobacillus siliginis]KRN95318.1 glycosyltransferase [Furfurilactobacillus siliginis]GEK28284.1 glycosyl transferase [Furfurilactobacillus siliginis]